MAFLFGHEDFLGGDYVAGRRFPLLRGPSSTDEAQRAERAFVVVPYRVELCFTISNLMRAIMF